jgi:flagellar protein FliO/FliZ
VVEQNIVRAVPVNPPRDVPVPRAESARTPETNRPQPFDDDAGWTPPPAEPARSSFARPEPAPRAARPEPRPFAEPLVRAPLPAGIAAPRSLDPSPPPIVPSGEPGQPDAALASMAQRLEAALRRPGEPHTPPAAAAQELAHGEMPPPTAPDDPNGRTGDAKGGKSKSVLDSLEAEMASLLGRPPEKT